MIVTRSFCGTRGVSAKMMVRMTLCSCRTLLCLRLCSNAVGAKSGSLVRNTAVPGTTCGGFFSRLCTSVLERHFGAARLLHQDAGAAPPGHHHQHDEAAERHRQPGALAELGRVRRPETHCRSRRTGSSAERCDHTLQCHIFQTTMKARHVGHHAGCGHRKDISRGEVARRAEQSDQQQHADQQAGYSPAACRSGRTATPKCGGSRTAAAARVGSPDG